METVQLQINHEEFINNINGNNLTNIYNENILIVCPDCKNKMDENDLIDSDGYIICSLCGLVLSMKISENAEWTNYIDSGGCSTNNSRCGVNTKTTDINPYSNNLISFMPKGIKDIYYKDGKMLKYDISKVHIKNNFNHLYKSFNIVEEHLDNIASDKYSKRIIQTAKILWAEITKTKKITRAGVRKGLIACCLYYACVHFNCTRSPMEICIDFGMTDTKQFNKGDKEFKETFENIPKWVHLLTNTSTSEDYFSRFCSDLEMEHILREGSSFQIAKECREINNAIEDKLIGLFPKSIACGIIFWVLKKNDINITKNAFSKLLGICSPTLTKIFQIIVDIIGEPNT